MPKRKVKVIEIKKEIKVTSRAKLLGVLWIGRIQVCKKGLATPPIQVKYCQFCVSAASQPPISYNMPVMPW